MPENRTSLRIGLIGALLIVAAFVGLQSTAILGRDSPDSRAYVSYALSSSGKSRMDATEQAIEYSCTSRQAKPLRWIPWTGETAPTESVDQCVRRLTDTADYWSRHGNTAGMTGPFFNSRFMAIFEARPGYPLFLVPFITAFGLEWGVWLAGLAVAVAGSVCVLLTLRTIRCSWAAALTGQALYLALPTGTIAMHPLSDGLTLALGAAGVLGSVLVVHSGRHRGMLLVVGALCAMFLVRYSQALLFAGVLAMAFLALAWWRSRRQRSYADTAVLTAVCGGLALASYTGAHLLGWPMGQDSAQDLLTHHYQRPDVKDVWPQFLAQERIYWAVWLQRQLTYPILPVMLALSAWAVWRRRDAFTLIALAAAAAGVLNQAGHPNLDQLVGYRLIVFIWLLPILTAPLLIDHWSRRRSTDPGPADLPLPRNSHPKSADATSLLA